MDNVQIVYGALTGNSSRYRLPRPDIKVIYGVLEGNSSTSSRPLANVKIVYGALTGSSRISEPVTPSLLKPTQRQEAETLQKAIKSKPVGVIKKLLKNILKHVRLSK